MLRGSNLIGQGLGLCVITLATNYPNHKLTRTDPKTKLAPLPLSCMYLHGQGPGLEEVSGQLIVRSLDTKIMSINVTKIISFNTHGHKIPFRCPGLLSP